MYLFMFFVLFSFQSATTLLRDVAILEAQKFKSLPERPKYLFLHRKEGDNEFMNIIHNEINDPVSEDMVLSI